MNTIVVQRCLNHPRREAAALCPQCHCFYCRECVTEHQDRMLCASCLRKLSVGITGESSFLRVLSMPLRLLLGFLILWFSFYLMGRGLLWLPTPFHEGTVWESQVKEVGP